MQYFVSGGDENAVQFRLDSRLPNEPQPTHMGLLWRHGYHQAHRPPKINTDWRTRKIYEYGEMLNIKAWQHL